MKKLLEYQYIDHAVYIFCPKPPGAVLHTEFAPLKLYISQYMLIYYEIYKHILCNPAFPFVPGTDDDGKKHLVITHHDESILHANDDQMSTGGGESETYMIRHNPSQGGLV